MNKVPTSGVAEKDSKRPAIRKGEIRRYGQVVNPHPLEILGKIFPSISNRTNEQTTRVSEDD